VTAATDVAPVSTFQRRVVLRPLGTPLPLGFLGLMVATAAFATVQLGWVAPDQGRFAGYAALLFTAPVQLLAAVLGFFARDPVAGTGMGVLSGTWAAYAVATLTSPPGALSPGVGVVLILAGVALLVPAAAATRKPVVAGVIALSALRFTLTGVAMTTGVHVWVVVAGWCGLLLAAASLYAALALELEGVQRREVLPLLRRGAGAREVAAHEEPGVRDEL
jgi:succinate-acetate transporter protein